MAITHKFLMPSHMTKHVNMFWIPCRKELAKSITHASRLAPFPQGKFIPELSAPSSHGADGTWVTGHLRWEKRRWKDVERHICDAMRPYWTSPDSSTSMLVSNGSSVYGCQEMNHSILLRPWYTSNEVLFSLFVAKKKLEKAGWRELLICTHCNK